MSKFNDLSPKQRRFVEEYLIDLNATQADGFFERDLPNTTLHRLVTRCCMARRLR